MAQIASDLGERVWDLPPLILHPFNERVSPSALLENSRAALMISGLIPADGRSPEELRRKLLVGRYSEVRMLFFLGKDILRWIDQCLEFAVREPELARLELNRQSFGKFVATHPPEAVREKLMRWGVADHVAIFSRAIGLNAVFAEPPDMECLGEEFLRGYHRYADQMFQAFLGSEAYREIGPANFRFELYASGEYSKLLEEQWERG